MVFVAAQRLPLCKQSALAYGYPDEARRACVAKANVVGPAALHFFWLKANDYIIKRARRADLSLNLSAMHAMLKSSLCAA